MDAVQACLGDAWTKQTMFYEFFVSVSEDDRQISVLLAAEIEHLRGYYIRTTVYRMNEVPLEVPPQSAEAST
jgi:1,2-phenylacetyl-CoA epoxidase catalytic subunit